ncbi:hypothetical protein [Phenylobacterium sp. SCN 70-31]|uniref:hypothetical protein n=1 Tax=Phenylobacterium sp. SCN 70-31 TaxID=1660129 RepID=UPI00086EF5FF|nr:hypothetical protein [Phenylobacterium sp. SCN 70-31]ODT86701.1 MAG: hypothetical protein ABS78_15580 [Phenylobacterium sp. SCN 70-31]
MIALRLAPYALTAALAVGLYHVTPFVGPGARIDRLKGEVASAAKARDAARDETKACQRNRAGLEASIAAHNRAVDGLKREADARVAESRKAAQAARAVAESHRRNVDRILSERIGPDKCAEAARLIDQYGE